ncbi:hypothetical protein [Thermococcus sp.]|uniref:hypothetical protein n=1 Tax=Thermococcus sp. TaxID=35749 RepID=UPI002620E77B|nr:hypothetical protein [Thermococcus sp.]
MILVVLSLLIGIMISFTPAILIPGTILVWLSSSLGKERRCSIEIASLIGSLLGAGLGIVNYGLRGYAEQWHSLWWIPAGRINSVHLLRAGELK